jgi:hypothetical protein
MTERTAEKVKRYCEAHGIEIPVWFHRHPAKRYVAIDTEAVPPKLVATSWFKQEDVVYFLTHLVPGRKHRLLDFKEGRELAFTGGARLEVGHEF